jgi:hypothetical protein
MATTQTATPNPAAEVAKLHKQLSAIKDRSPLKARAIRRALRILGHRGGTRTVPAKK